MKKYILIVSIAINIVFVALVIRHFAVAPHGVAQSGYFMNRDKIFKSLPVDSGSIVFIGDSEIAGFDFSEWFNDLRIKNRGIPFDTTLGELNRIDDIIARHPAKVFIQGGINDLKNKIRPDSIGQNMVDIIYRIQKGSPATKLYLLSVLPTNIKIQSIDVLNKMYAIVANTYKITFINLDPAFNRNGGLKYDSGDGIHVSGEGYKKWTEILLPYIKQSEPPN